MFLLTILTYLLTLSDNITNNIETSEYIIDDEEDDEINSMEEELDNDFYMDYNDNEYYYDNFYDFMGWVFVTNLSVPERN